jgi:hypothetical protein
MTTARPVPPCQGGHQSDMCETVGTAQHSPILDVLQRHSEFALSRLRHRHFRFVRSAGQWFRWTPEDGWAKTSTSEVYECINWHLDNTPRWLLRYIAAEAQRDPQISGKDYWALMNAPAISFAAHKLDYSIK